jgi:hypothetical protein
MPTNLTTVRDHPAAILQADNFQYAARSLTDYEVEHKITFAALDNDALAEVRAQYAIDPFDAPSTVGLLNDLRAAVNSLLGLDD